MNKAHLKKSRRSILKFFAFIFTGIGTAFVKSNTMANSKRQIFQEQTAKSSNRHLSIFEWNVEQVSLESDKGIDYVKLQNLLKARNWKEANEETVARISEVMGTSSWIKIARENMLLNFPCKDLKTIDQLWVQASQGLYGISVQQQIYLECGGKPDGKYSGDTDCGREFGDKIGWRINGEWISNYSRLKWDGTGTKGHLPWIGLKEWESTALKGIWSFSSVSPRVVYCNI